MYSQKNRSWHVPKALGTHCPRRGHPLPKAWAISGHSSTVYADGLHALLQKEMRPPALVHQSSSRILPACIERRKRCGRIRNEVQNYGPGICISGLFFVSLHNRKQNGTQPARLNPHRRTAAPLAADTSDHRLSCSTHQG